MTSSAREPTRESPPGGQAARPHGLGGRLLGRSMAFLNDAMNRRALAHLDLQPGLRSLEIGFGPGKSLARLARSGSFVAGVDPSEAMLSQARARNRRALAEGRMELQLGTVSALPYPDRSFDRALAVNCFQFFEDPPADLAEIHRVLRPAGRLVLGIRVREPSAPRLFDRIALERDALDEVAALLRTVGFEDMATRIEPVRFMTAASLIATR